MTRKLAGPSPAALKFVQMEKRCAKLVLQTERALKQASDERKHSAKLERDNAKLRQTIAAADMLMRRARMRLMPVSRELSDELGLFLAKL